MNNEPQYAEIRSSLLAAGLNPEQDCYVIGADYADECRALWADDQFWYVGNCERGKKFESSRFKSRAEAVEYLVFLVLGPALKNGKLTKFPSINLRQ
jgi:hypothetical protein